MAPERCSRALGIGPLWLAVCAALLGGGSASGHKLKVFATADGTTIRGSAYFRASAPARNSKVEVFDPAGKKLAETATDEQGKFTFEARVRCDHRIVVVSGDGHRAEYLLEAAELPDELPAPETGSEPAPEQPERSAAKPQGGAGHVSAAELEKAIERAVRKQVNPLREQLDRFEDRRTLLDVLGGVGYIVGIVGIAFYFLGAARRKRAPSSSD